MVTEVSVKTYTEVTQASGQITVTCFSDLNANNNTNPSIYKTSVLQEDMEIDGIRGIEGELIVSNDAEKSSVELNPHGDLIISVEGDLESNYTLNNENLEYNG
jgi:hypothetical protein